MYITTSHFNRNSSAGSGGGGSSEGGGCSSSMGGSLERPNHSAGPSRIPANPPATETPGEDTSKKSRVDDTRFDANDIIDKLFQDTIEPIKPDDSAESKWTAFSCCYHCFHFL